MQLVYPTGTTLYKPDKCFNGYTLYPSRADELGAVLVDMNGELVRSWPQYQGFMVNLLPGGQLLGGQVGRATPRYDHVLGSDDVVQESWEGEVLWKFGGADEIEVDGRRFWSARQNHDLVREGAPVGYFVPGMTPGTQGGKTLMLSYGKGCWPDVTRAYLPRASRILEVSWEGEIIWDWMPANHFDQFGHSSAARESIMRCCRNQHCVFQNTASYVGPNKWFDDGDERFHPDNIITDDRGTIIYIISRQTGDIVWKIGPDYSENAALIELGTIIGPHHAHMIPKGLPGAGNILVFDNGGAAGFGPANPGSTDGTWNALRDFSRVLEIDPISLEPVWEFSARTSGFAAYSNDSRFYSHFEGSVQRLPNGNTLISESNCGRIIEVTRDSEVVWEYISPHSLPGKNFSSDVFRAYRYPYDWVEQVARPVERPVIPPPNSEFRIAAQER